MSSEFTWKLLKWNAESNRRDMPWKGETDPYKIWLSEVILQQTRVEQGQAYYENFVSAFPTIHSLAAASETAVFKMWEGLGYYSRCRNLHHTARFISQHLAGKFPGTYEEILKLKGVGPYTAAAIASFAFNEKRAVVDGNVQRVLSRYFGISTPTGSTSGKRLFAELAQSLIDDVAPGLYNQAIMDFGATICKPKRPLCSICFQSLDCEAFKHHFVDALPVSEKISERRTRWLYYFIIEVGDSVFVRKREKKDIWQNLHEFVLLERDEPDEDPSSDFLQQTVGRSYAIKSVSPARSQQLTHQQINGKFWEVRLPVKVDIASYQLIKRSELKDYAFPRFINSYLEDHA